MFNDSGTSVPLQITMPELIETLPTYSGTEWSETPAEATCNHCMWSGAATSNVDVSRLRAHAAT